jgi:hypothetical protein
VEIVEAVPIWLVIVLVCLATHRVTRFVTRDAFPLVAGPRRWIEHRWDPFTDDEWAKWRTLDRQHRRELVAQIRAVPNNYIGWPNPVGRSVAYLVTCDWCTSIWVGAGLIAVTRWWLGWDWFFAALVWLTASTVTGLIAQREPE